MSHHRRGDLHRTDLTRRRPAGARLPRWSVGVLLSRNCALSQVLVGMALMAGEPIWGSRVSVGPPLLASGPSTAPVLVMSVLTVAKQPVVSPIRL